MLITQASLAPTHVRPYGRGCRTICSQNIDIAWMGGGRSAPCQDLEDLSTMHWGPSKVIIHHQKVIIFSQKVCLIPQNRSFNHISLTFSLKWFTHFCRKMLRVAFTRFFVGQICQGARGSTQFRQCQDFGCIWTTNPLLSGSMYLDFKI